LGARSNARTCVGQQGSGLVGKPAAGSFNLIEPGVWDADFRYWNGTWKSLSFSGTRWLQVNTAEGRLYPKNAYRVILTRARQGMIVFVPKGAEKDATRPACQLRYGGLIPDRYRR
jgi:hypothetical protein